MHSSTNSQNLLGSLLAWPTLDAHCITNYINKSSTRSLLETFFEELGNQQRSNWGMDENLREYFTWLKLHSKYNRDLATMECKIGCGVLYILRHLNRVEKNVREHTAPLKLHNKHNRDQVPQHLDSTHKLMCSSFPLVQNEFCLSNALDG